MTYPWASGEVLTAADLNAALGVNRVLQVVQNTTTSTTSTTSTSFVTGGLTATITPTLASSKVLILTMASFRTTGDGLRGIATIFRGDPSSGGVNLASTATSNDGFVDNLVTAATNLSVGQPMLFLDSPASTSATTYYYAIAAQSSFTTVSVQGAASEAVMILMEVSA
jgi:hypothetical protein